MHIRWHVYPDPARLAEATAERISERATLAVAERDAFRLVLAGGSTPHDIYLALADRDADWAKWQVYFTDERCLPTGHPDRNEVMAHSTLLDHVPIPAQQVHAIPAELGPERGANAYRAILAEVGDFDLTLLGLGEDGHTASLFPGHPRGAEPGAPDVLAVTDAPKPPPDRVSLSAARLSRSRDVVVLVSGTGKRCAVRRLYERADIPICAITPEGGMDVMIDSAAAIPDLTT